MKTVLLLPLVLMMSVVLVCGAELEVGDFNFSGPLGSDGARIEKLGKNHFRVTLGHAPNHPEWPNKLNFQIVRNAKGNGLRLEVVFEGGKSMAFNEYFQSWSYDGKTWRPVQWEKGYKESPQRDWLMFPVFERDRVFVGTQVPMSFEEVEQLIRRWRKHPAVKVRVVGKSLEGRNLYRLEITDPNSDVPRPKRWVHYFANQHPGEHNSQWRIVGMVDWILSDEATQFRRNSICHVILMMSPDGPSHGWYRINAQGVDMNRSYRAAGADPKEQAHEAFLWQKDLEALMASEAPVTTIWSCHTWSGIVEPLLTPGPEIGSRLPPWTEFARIMQSHDSRSLVKPLKLRTGQSSYGPTTWSGGPHAQFGITAILCEGAATLFTKEDNIESGKVLIKAIADYYSGHK